jgi:hypothetical protein
MAGKKKGLKKASKLKGAKTARAYKMTRAAGIKMARAASDKW